MISLLLAIAAQQLGPIDDWDDETPMTRLSAIAILAIAGTTNPSHSTP